MTERLYRAVAFLFGASAAAFALTIAAHFLGRRIAGGGSSRWPS